MNISNSYLCVECDAIFPVNPDTTGDFGYLVNRYRQQCPSCGSQSFMPLANAIMPLSNINQNNNIISHVSQ